MVLRVQALEARGKTREADALAEDFLDKNPESAHAPRVERATLRSAVGCGRSARKQLNLFVSVVIHPKSPSLLQLGLGKALALSLR